MAKRRVVVTGLGMLTPLANSVEETWKRVLAGESGIGPLDTFDCSGLTTRFAGLIRDFDPQEYGMTKKDARKMDYFIQYGVAAAEQAIADSGVEFTEANAHRASVVVGSGIGGVNNIEKNFAAFDKFGLKKVSPFFVPSTITNMVAGNISMRHGIKGPNFCITTACTTGTHNIGHGARLITYGDADVVVAGSSELGSCPLGMAGFCAARALSTRNDEPQKASRPWDKDRDGFVLADGAGIVVLEELEHAKARGAKIYAELTGFGMSSDAHHITAPPEDGAGAALSMKNCLVDGELNADEVDYVNAHGTSTPLGDLAEIRALKSVLGNGADSVSVSSTKSMIGHLLGAAGSVEAIFSVLAIRDQVAPPTINLDNPEEEIDLDLVPHVAKERKIDTALSNSFGFGGTNGSLLFKRFVD